MNNFRIALVNGILFQALWFVCVQGNDLFALLATLFFFFIHLAFIVRGLREIVFIIGFASVGWMVDSLGNTAGLITFSGSMPVSVVGVSFTLAPIWLLCVWMSFSSTLIYSLYWLHKRLRAAALLGFLLVPLNYLVGAKFSGSELGLSVPAFLLLEGFVWALLLPLGLALANRYMLEPVSTHLISAVASEKAPI